MLELILLGASAVSGITFYSLRKPIFGKIATNDFSSRQKARLEELMKTSAADIKPKFRGTLRHYLYAVDIVAGHKSEFPEKLMLTHEEKLALEPPKSSPMHAPLKNSIDADSVVHFARENLKLAFSHFLLILHIDREELTYYMKHYDTILKHNREMVSNITEVAHAVERQTREQKWKTLSSVKKTMDTAIEKEKQEEETRIASSIQTYHQLLEESEEEVPEDYLPEGQKRHEKKGHQFFPSPLGGYPPSSKLSLNSLQRIGLDKYMKQVYDNIRYIHLEEKGHTRTLELAPGSMTLEEYRRMTARFAPSVAHLYPVVIDNEIYFQEGLPSNLSDFYLEGLRRHRRESTDEALREFFHKCAENPQLNNLFVPPATHGFLHDKLVLSRYTINELVDMFLTSNKKIERVARNIRYSRQDLDTIVPYFNYRLEHLGRNDNVVLVYRDREFFFVVLRDADFK